jgi:hypothetical protein
MQWEVRGSGGHLKECIGITSLREIVGAMTHHWRAHAIESVHRKKWTPQ